MVVESAVVNVSQVLICVVYVFLTGMILFQMRYVARWTRRVSLYVMLSITVTWAAFYAYAIFGDPLSRGPFVLEFAVLLSRLAQIPIMFGVGIMMYMIYSSEEAEARAVRDVLNGEG